MAPTPLRLDRDTLIPIGLLVAVVIAAISATVWINTYLVTISAKIDILSTQVREIDQDAWTSRDMSSWVALAKAMNDGKLNLPEPRGAK